MYYYINSKYSWSLLIIILREIFQNSFSTKAAACRVRAGSAGLVYRTLTPLQPLCAQLHCRLALLAKPPPWPLCFPSFALRGSPSLLLLHPWSHQTFVPFLIIAHFLVVAVEISAQTFLVQGSLFI